MTLALRLLSLFLCFGFACAFAADRAKERREDFDAMWRAIDAHYAYFDRGTRAGWKRSRGAWRARAAAAASREEFAAVLEQALATLHDDHVQVAPRTPRSPRRVPQDTDLWASWRDGRATIESVRYAGDADYVGVRPGETVARVDGVPIARATQGLLARPGESGAADRDWALRHVLAGPVAGTMVLELGDDRPRRVEVERGNSSGSPQPAPATLSSLIGENRDIAYLRWKRVGPQELPAVDAALDMAKGKGVSKAARAIVLDLRGTEIDNRAVTLAILARLAVREGPWQIREGRNGKRDADRLTPVNGQAARPALIVLVDRWTAGEAEALAAGLAAIASARLVGTPMAGLRGELHEVRLPHSAIAIRFPAEKSFTPDGTPRESLRPALEVNLAAPNGGPGDPILYQALKLGSDSNFTNSGSLRRLEPEFR